LYRELGRERYRSQAPDRDGTAPAVMLHRSKLESVLCPQPGVPMNARLREIPYNHTSFSDREILIRLLGA
jgi:hypothetical protein